jgi:hypothetical protein
MLLYWVYGLEVSYRLGWSCGVRLLRVEQDDSLSHQLVPLLIREAEFFEESRSVLSEKRRPPSCK